HEKEIEAALRDSETRLRLAVEAAGLGVCEKDAVRGAARLDTRAAGLTFGAVPADAWLGFDGPELTAWKATVHPDDAALRAASEQALIDGTRDRLTTEYRVRRPDGSWGWLAAFSSIAERERDTQRTLRVLTVVQDITQRKETEIELRHAQRMEAVGQLTGGVAHDFNNLLGAILGHAEFLLENLHDRPEDHELAAHILDCTLSGTALTQRLLAFARRQALQP